MKNLLATAVLLLAFGTVSAQTGKDTITSKNKDKSHMTMHKDGSQPSTTLDQNKKSGTKSKAKTANRNDSAPRNTDGTMTNGTTAPRSNTEPTGTTRTSPGSGNTTK